MTNPEQLQIAEVGEPAADNAKARSSLQTDFLNNWEGNVPTFAARLDVGGGENGTLYLTSINEVISRELPPQGPPGEAVVDERPTRTYPTSDGGTAHEYGDRTEITWPDGTKRADFKDGTGYLERPGPDGTLTVKGWGPKPQDNFEGRRDPGGYAVAKYADGRIEEQWPNGVYKVDNGDGTGYTRHPQADGSSVEKHWGPRADDNYTRTEWRDGSFREESPDGKTGVARQVQPDGSVVTTSWGPNQADNHVTTEWRDGTVRVNRSDGTGYVQRPVEGKPDYYFRRHWGPEDQDNYLIANNGAQQGTVDATQRAYEQLPRYVKDLLGPTLIVTADKPSNADPRFAGDDGEWSGVFQPGTRQKIVVTDAASASEKGAEGVLRHEVGHNIDRALGYPSQTTEFGQAFTDDVSNMPPDFRKKIEYYWTEKDTKTGTVKTDMKEGASQMYAEVFRVLQTPPHQRSEHDRQLLQYLPRVTAQVQNSLDRAQR